MSIFGDRKQKKKEAKKLVKKVTYESRPHLLAMKPNERYVFHSDYFEIDGKVACIMAFFAQHGANRTLPPFWGVRKIPRGLDTDIITCNLEQIRRLPKSWVDAHQHKAEDVTNRNIEAQSENGTITGQQKVVRTQNDLEVITQELLSGASYLNVHDRMLVVAPTLKKLENAIMAIDRWYSESMGSVWAAPYNGEQRDELSGLFKKNEFKKGKGFYFTSTEFAGEYNLVTHGLEDLNGEYVGAMTNDYNNSAVLFDVDGFSHHVVIASDEVYHVDKREIGVSDVWGSKLAQSCLLNDHKVVHILFSNADLNMIGPEFKNITSNLNLNHGDLNMFEMFGKEENELDVFEAQQEKLVLMAEQMCESNDNNRAIIHAWLKDVVRKFYIGQRMWAENAKENRDRLRVVGLNHEDVPLLHMFVSYLDVEYKALVNASARDEEHLRAISILLSVFKNLLTANGDLFNVATSSAIDGVVNSRRVVYDFSGLIDRSKSVAMAQLVNIIGYAVRNLSDGDLVLFHGVDQVDDKIKKYILSQFDLLYKRGGRVAFLYNNIDKFLNDIEFNQFDKVEKSGYTILGNMTSNQIDKYQDELNKVIPPDLIKALTNESDGISYIRRGFDNVLFHRDLLVKPEVVSTQKKRKRYRRKVV